MKFEAVEAFLLQSPDYASSERFLRLAVRPTWGDACHASIYYRIEALLGVRTEGISHFSGSSEAGLELALWYLVLLKSLGDGRGAMGVTLHPDNRRVVEDGFLKAVGNLWASGRWREESGVVEDKIHGMAGDARDEAMALAKKAGASGGVKGAPGSFFVLTSDIVRVFELLAWGFGEERLSRFQPLVLDCFRKLSTIEDVERFRSMLVGLRNSSSSSTNKQVGRSSAGAAAPPEEVETAVRPNNLKEGLLLSGDDYVARFREKYQSFEKPLKESTPLARPANSPAERAQQATSLVEAGVLTGSGTSSGRAAPTAPALGDYLPADHQWWLSLVPRHEILELVLYSLPAKSDPGFRLRAAREFFPAFAGTDIIARVVSQLVLTNWEDALAICVLFPEDTVDVIEYENFAEDVSDFSHAMMKEESSGGAVAADVAGAAKEVVELPCVSVQEPPGTNKDRTAGGRSEESALTTLVSTLPMLKSAWPLLKKGLREPRSKKRAKFLVERVVEEESFRWYWPLFDATEEFASHWIKQNWNKFEDLIDTASSKPDTTVLTTASSSAGAAGAPFPLSAPWVDFLLEACMSHENPSVCRFVLDRLVRKSPAAFSKRFIYKTLMPHLSQHAWYLNNSTPVNEELVKKFFADEDPRDVLNALCTDSDATTAYFVPLRVFLEVLHGCVGKRVGSKGEGVEEHGTSPLHPHLGNFWSAREFAQAVKIAERGLRNMPRAARYRLVNLLIMVFVNNFDPNFAANHKNQSGVESSDEEKFSFAGADGGGEALSVLNKHVLLLRFFAAIPSDIAQAYLSEVLCGIEFDAVFRAMFFYLLQEDVLVLTKPELGTPGSTVGYFGGNVGGASAYVEQAMRHLPRGASVAGATVEDAEERKRLLEAGVDPDQNAVLMRRRSVDLLEQVHKLLARQKLIGLPLSRTLVVGLARVLKVVRHRLDEHSPSDEEDHSGLGYGVSETSLPVVHRNVAQDWSTKGLVRSCLARLLEMCEGVYTKTYLSPTVVQHAALFLSLLVTDGLVDGYSLSEQDLPGAAQHQHLHSALMRINTDPLAEYCASALSDPKRVWTDGSLFVTLLHHIQIPTRILPTLTKLVVSGLRGLPAASDAEQALAHRLQAIGTGQDIFFGSHSDPRSTRALEEELLAKNPTKTFLALALAGVVFRAVKATVRPDQIQLARVVAADGGPERVVCAGSPAAESGAAATERLNVGAGRVQPVHNPGLAGTGSSDSSLANVTLNEILNLLYPFILRRHDYGMLEKDGVVTEKPRAAGLLPKALEERSYAEQYYARYAKQPPSFLPHDGRPGIEHFLHTTLEDVWRNRYEKLSVECTRLLIEGMPPAVSSDVPATVGRVAARLSVEFHKWRSLLLVFEGAGAQHFEIDTLLDAFDGAGPPETGFLSQMLARFPPRAWTRERLENLSKVVSGFSRGASTEGYDYGILSEACYAAFNANTVAAEMNLLVEEEKKLADDHPHDDHLATHGRGRGDEESSSASFVELVSLLPDPLAEDSSTPPPTPLLKLLDRILVSGESQLNVVRAAVLPLLGALSTVTEGRAGRPLPGPYAAVLAKMLVYNEAVLRDASWTLGEFDLLPFGNTAKNKFGGAAHPGDVQEDDAKNSASSGEFQSSESDSLSSGEMSGSHRAARGATRDKNVPKLPLSATAQVQEKDADLNPGYEQTILLGGAQHSTLLKNKHSTTALPYSTRIAESSAFTRVAALCFFERSPQLAAQALLGVLGLLDAHLEKATAKSKTRNKKTQVKNVIKPGVPNNLSEYHRMQLRAWQSIIVLLNVVDGRYLVGLLPKLMRHFTVPQLSDVRSYAEYAMCVLAEREQHRLQELQLPRSEVGVLFQQELHHLFEEIAESTPQCLASAMIVACYWADHTVLLDKSDLEHQLLPFLTSNIALVRGTAQLVYWRIHSSSSKKKQAFPPHPPGRHARQILRMLNEHKDTVKMRERLEVSLDLWDPKRASQLEALFLGGESGLAGKTEKDRPDYHVASELDSVYDYRPRWQFLNELKTQIDSEMQGLWYKHTEQDELQRRAIIEERSPDECFRRHLVDQEKAKMTNDIRSGEERVSATAQASALGQSMVAATSANILAGTNTGGATSATAQEITLARKFDPLSGGNAQVDDLFFALLAEKEQHNCAKRRPLVVCASLIDKASNLGGLARTCEIFSAEALTVPNKDIVKDTTFQALAVTADRWMPLWEVLPASLPEWLQYQKRHKNYLIVGVEQTHHSVCLSDFHFPSEEERGVVLLLGAEKEGLPAELIAICDVCVEIPQDGMLRSLNVHVSGALLVWEYVRQGLLARKSQGAAGVGVEV